MLPVPDRRDFSRSGVALLPSIHRFTCFHMENKCADRYHLIAVPSAKAGKKQTASSNAREPARWCATRRQGKKREGEKSAQQTTRQLRDKLRKGGKRGTLFLPHKPLCAGLIRRGCLWRGYGCDGSSIREFSALSPGTRNSWRHNNIRLGYMSTH